MTLHSKQQPPRHLCAFNEYVHTCDNSSLVQCCIHVHICICVQSSTPKDLWCIYIYHMWCIYICTSTVYLYAMACTPLICVNRKRLCRRCHCGEWQCFFPYGKPGLAWQWVLCAGINWELSCYDLNLMLCFCYASTHTLPYAPVLLLEQTDSCLHTHTHCYTAYMLFRHAGVYIYTLDYTVCCWPAV